MPNDKPETAPPLLIRPEALSRWDNEGGAGPDGPQQPSRFAKEVGNGAEMSNATLAQLQVRVIALENVAVALLAGASHQQLAAVLKRAGSITRPPGSTQQPMTILAATEMIHLVERAEHSRS